MVVGEVMKTLVVDGEEYNVFKQLIHVQQFFHPLLILNFMMMNKNVYYVYG